MKTLLSAVTSGSSAEDHPSGATLPISSMSFARRAPADAVECPKCGKRSIVERSSNIFDCLNCSFHRELPPVAHRSGPSRTTPLPLSNPLSKSQGSRRQRGVTQGAVLSPPHPGLLPRRNLNTLLSNDIQHGSLSRFSLDMDEEMMEPEKSQPWLFAFLAVVFGILLL